MLADIGGALSSIGDWVLGVIDSNLVAVLIGVGIAEYVQRRRNRAEAVNHERANKRAVFLLSCELLEIYDQVQPWLANNGTMLTLPPKLAFQQYSHALANAPDPTATSFLWLYRTIELIKHSFDESASQQELADEWVKLCVPKVVEACDWAIGAKNEDTVRKASFIERRLLVSKG